MTPTGGRNAPLLLMTPGPTRVPGAVLDAGAQPMIHHRTPEFSRILVSVVERLRPLYGTTAADVLPVHTTGRGGMEAAIANLLCAGDEIVACCNGKFGTMWANIAESYGLIVHRVCTRWDSSVDAAEVEQALRDHPGARALTVIHGDTSTGVLNDVASVLAVTRSRDVLGMVDCISVLGGTPFRFDEWGADVAVTGSQKCLMSSPGLAFVAVSKRAWPAYERGRLARNYWDFQAVRQSLAKAQPETPGTPPVHIFMQLAAALTLIHEEGLANVFARHEAMARLARERSGRLGLDALFPSLRRHSPTLTALRTPAGVAPKDIRAGLKERGILVAGALGDFASDGFRIGHMGDIRIADVEHTCDALAEVLAGLSAAGSALPLAARD
ncbi:MAG: pyridoxal-phosphate-dependent aminotransferase family protein [Gemmatimonadales bacterium]